MDDNNGVESSKDRDNSQTDADLPASTIIGANIAGINAGTYPGAIVAPAAEAAEAEEVKGAKQAERTEGAEDEADLEPIKPDELAQFLSDEKKSHNEGAANEQSGG